MKCAIYLLLIFLAACGEELPPEEPGQGLRRTQELSADDNLVASELSNLRKVCNHLSMKDRYFQGNVINSDQQFDFQTEYKACEDTDKSSGLVSLALQQSGTIIKFVKSSGQADYFSDYEGMEQGLIAPFCERVNQTTGSILRYMETGNKVSWIYPLGTNTTYCPNDTNTLCVVIEEGISSVAASAMITERHSFAIADATYGAKEGMVITRMLESTTDCAESYRYLFSSLKAE